MRILLLAAANDIHTVRWANSLSENGHEIHLCYVSNQKPAIDKFHYNVFLHKLLFPAPYGYYLNVVQLKMIIKKVKPDIINVHYSSGYGTLGRVVNFSPYLVSVYGSDVYDYPYQKKFNMNNIRKNLLAADGIASTSNAMAVQVTKLIKYKLDDIYITPFGVDIDKFKKQFTRERDNTFVIGSIKKLSPKYGMKYGILAIDHLVKNLLQDNNLKLKYYIYGVGEEQDDLINLVNKNNLQDIVEFKGRIPNTEVPHALNEMDVFLGNSILNSESFGVAIVEAMSCGLPVIVTDVDGFKEVVDDGKAGIVVPKKNPVAMAKALYNLIINPKLREDIGTKQRKRVVENYNWKENVKHMENVYTELMNKNK